MRNERGFTLIEVLSVIAILAVLGAIAVPAYNSYINKAAAVDILAKYENAREQIDTSLAGGNIENCYDLVPQKLREELKDKYAIVVVNFYPVKPTGYRPVLTIGSFAAYHGKHGLDVTKEAYNQISKNMEIEPEPSIHEISIMFSIPLTKPGTAVCENNAVPPNSAAALPAATPPAATPPAATPAPCTNPREVRNIQTGRCEARPIPPKPSTPCRPGSTYKLMEDANYNLNWACMH